MQAMGATVIDVAQEFARHLVKFSESFPGVVSKAFVEIHGYQVRLTTLLAKDCNDAEDDLARMELDLEDSFREMPMTFATIHLRGRAPEMFIPESGALVIFDSELARRRANVAAAE